MVGRISIKALCTGWDGRMSRMCIESVSIHPLSMIAEMLEILTIRVIL